MEDKESSRLLSRRNLLLGTAGLAALCFSSAFVILEGGRIAREERNSIELSEKRHQRQVQIESDSGLVVETLKKYNSGKFPAMTVDMITEKINADYGCEFSREYVFGLVGHLGNRCMIDEGINTINTHDQLCYGPKGSMFLK